MRISNINKIITFFLTFILIFSFSTKIVFGIPHVAVRHNVIRARCHPSNNQNNKIKIEDKKKEKKKLSKPLRIFLIIFQIICFIILIINIIALIKEIIRIILQNL